METIVCKFGGTCAADAACFQRIRRILDSNPARRYAVLSAPCAAGDSPKVTDLLYRLWSARHDGAGARAAAEAVAARYSAIAGGLGLPDPREGVLYCLEDALDDSLEATVSRGEYLCAQLFSEYAGLPMVDAKDVIRFDHGRLDEAATCAALRDMAQKHPRAVLPGFYGGDRAGGIALLSRNGSDITGALTAAGVGAALYENWTDVPGLMTADPAVHPDARVIPEISYAEMRSRAEAGARVLHPDCLAPVAAAGIPVRLCWVIHPELPGTMITSPQ